MLLVAGMRIEAKILERLSNIEGLLLKDDGSIRSIAIDDMYIWTLDDFYNEHVSYGV